MSDQTPRTRVVVLASGKGSNFEALALATRGERTQVDLVGLVGDRPSAGCFARAQALGVKSLPLPVDGRDRASYDLVLAGALEDFEPDWVLLLGWMRILSNAFLARFPGRVINLHPALPGRFPGTDAIRRAWEASREGRIDRTGVMLHFVPDEGVDTGPPILVRELPIAQGESLVSLEARMHQLEHDLVVELATRLRHDDIEDRVMPATAAKRQGGTT